MKFSARISSERGAVISPCQNYRYALWRRWDVNAPYALFVGLNPSTADESADDPTIRRCKRYAKDWGFGGLYMVNLFALRATSPKDMLRHADPVGVNNDCWLLDLVPRAGVVVCAWGALGGHLGRDVECAALLEAQQLMCLGVTKAGHPRHPLYVRADKALEPYRAR